jgi:Flp pilus assembly protein protease CpaA
MLRWSLLGFCVAAAFVELRYHRIPNWLCLAGMLTGVIWNLEPSFAGAAAGMVGALPFWMLYRAEEDHVKMMTAVGALTSWLGALAILAAAVVVAAISQAASHRPLAGSLAILAAALAWMFLEPLLPANLIAAARP